MLKQEQQIGNASGAPLFHERALHRQRLDVRDDAEPPYFNLPHGTETSSTAGDGLRTAQAPSRRP
jgi:hypothetical protein